MDAVKPQPQGIAPGRVDFVELVGKSGPPKGARFTSADQVSDQVELSPKARRMQQINAKMRELISGDSAEEYRPMKLGDMLKAVRGQ